MPLTELSREGAGVADGRDDSVTRIEIIGLLQDRSVPLCLAVLGEPVRWIDGDERDSVWRAELSPRLVETGSFDLADFPDERAYVASRWRLVHGSAVLLFEQHH